jgi:hypothetical protein
MRITARRPPTAAIENLRSFSLDRTIVLGGYRNKAQKRRGYPFLSTIEIRLTATEVVIESNTTFFNR